MTCTSTASPPTTLIWTRDEELVSFEGSPNQTHSLSITDRPSSTYSSLLSDSEGVSGRYMCTVANEFGNDSREITVDSGELCLYMPSLFTSLVLEQKHRYGAHI